MSEVQSVRAIGRGVCWKCSEQAFYVYLYGDGSFQLRCQRCEEVWTPPSGGTSPEALGGVWNERADVVPEAQGEA